MKKINLVDQEFHHHLKDELKLYDLLLMENFVDKYYQNLVSILIENQEEIFENKDK